MTAGRPSTYTPEMAERICEGLLTKDAEGRPQSLEAVLKAEGMPDERTVRRWLKKHEEFRREYASAREEQAHMLADSVVEIADTEPDPNKARVRIDARKWYAGKLNGKYSDKVVNEHTGKDGAPIKLEADTQDDARLIALMLTRAVSAPLPAPSSDASD